MIQAVRDASEIDRERVLALWQHTGWTALVGIVKAEAERQRDVLCGGQETGLERIGWMRGRIAALNEIARLPETIDRESRANEDRGERE